MGPQTNPDQPDQDLNSGLSQSPQSGSQGMSSLSRQPPPPGHASSPFFHTPRPTPRLARDYRHPGWLPAPGEAPRAGPRALEGDTGVFVPFLAENKRSKSEAKVARFGKTSVQPEIQDRLLLRGRPPARAPTRSSPEDLQSPAAGGACPRRGGWRLDPLPPVEGRLCSAACLSSSSGSSRMP